MVSVNYSNYLIYNPEGKVEQLEFIQRTTELGSTALALCNSRCGVLIGHKDRRSKLADLQKKVYKINKSTLFTFSGITNDGLTIVDYLIDKSISDEVIKDKKIHYLDVFEDLCYDAVIRTIANQGRLYGVSGLLLTDCNGVKISHFDPRGLVKEVRGMSIGNRAQSCRTVLEVDCMKFDEMSTEELIACGTRALKNAHSDQGALNEQNVEIWVLEVGKEVYNVNAGAFLN